MDDLTTIQVRRTTVQSLDMIKNKYKVSSYDKAIRKMAQKELKIPDSMFGTSPKIKKFVRDEGDFHEL